MGHQIGHRVYHCSTSEKAILKDLNSFAYDPQETSGYHGNIKFHRDIVSKNEDEAYKVIEKLDDYPVYPCCCDCDFADCDPRLWLCEVPA